jgi:hypothetical protein
MIAAISSMIPIRRARPGMTVRTTASVFMVSRRGGVVVTGIGLGVVSIDVSETGDLTVARAGRAAPGITSMSTCDCIGVTGRPA